MAKYPKLIPESVYETFGDVETSANELTAEEKKEMNGADAKAFNALRQKLKKTLAARAEEMKLAAMALEKSAGDMKAGRLDEALNAPKVIEMTPENVLRKLQEVIGSRGRKHADKQENLAVLRRLYELAANDHHRVQVLVGTIAAQFDMIVASVGHLSLEIWVACVADTSKLVSILSTITALTPEWEAEAEENGLPNLPSLRGSLLSFAQRLDDEFTKALQIIDAHSGEYEEFLRAEGQLYGTLQRCAAYFEATRQADFQLQLVLRQIDHLYFRPSSILGHLDGANPKTLAQLCSLVYRAGSDKMKVRALLSHVYHLALHGHFAKAKELFTMSRIAEGLSGLEVSSQILYNRTVAQLGLAAFQRGLLKDAYFALQEICSSGRPKELLAQGLQSAKYAERTPEQERAERQRQLPAHMHINIELLDAVFLACSMLLEIPQAAASARRFFRGDRKLFQSRHLRRLIDQYDRNLFNGPPENTRDHVIAATKALASGDWRTCHRLMLTSRLWNLFPNPPAIHRMLHLKIREAGFCTLLLAFGPNYKSLELAYLSTLFEIPSGKLEKIIERLVGEHGLPVTVADGFIAWSQEVEVSPIQELVMQIKDKAQLIAERNDESLDFIHKHIDPVA
jgi:translation initiation factor 3 subunit C